MDLSWLGSGVHVNWLDVLLGSILALGLARGVWTGFSRSMSSLLGVVLGFWVAVHHFQFVSLRISRFIGDPMWCPLVAFFLLFFLVYLTFALAGLVVQALFKAVRLGWVDRAMGAVVGLAKGLVLAGVLVFLLTVFLPADSPVLKGSVLYPGLTRVAKVLGGLVPEDVRGRFMWKWRRVHPRARRRVAT